MQININPQSQDGQSCGRHRGSRLKRVSQTCRGRIFKLCLCCLFLQISIVSTEDDLSWWSRLFRFPSHPQRHMTQLFQCQGFAFGSDFSRTAKRLLKCIIRTWGGTTVTQNTNMDCQIVPTHPIVPVWCPDRIMGTKKCCVDLIWPEAPFSLFSDRIQSLFTSKELITLSRLEREYLQKPHSATSCNSFFSPSSVALLLLLLFI